MKKRTALILGGTGFIGSNLSNRLMTEGYFCRVVDIKPYTFGNLVCDEFIQGDLRDPAFVSKIMIAPDQLSLNDKEHSFDEVYQFAALMGGAQFIFTGENDADVIHDSSLINLNVAKYASMFNVKKLFYSSSACIYPLFNQLDPNNPNCKEESAIPASPDSTYGWEKLCSEFMYDAFRRNKGLNVYIGRFHNIFGPGGDYNTIKAKAPAALCTKVITCMNNGTIEVFGPGTQTRSFLYIDECISGIRRLMNQDKFFGPVNIGSDEMISINDLAKMIIGISGKNISIKNVPGPVGVNGRNSDNNLIFEKLNWKPSQLLRTGIEKTYDWIKLRIENENKGSENN